MEFTLLVLPCDPPLRWELDVVELVKAPSSESAVARISILPVQSDSYDADCVLPCYRSLLAQLVSGNGEVVSPASADGGTAAAVCTFLDTAASSPVRPRLLLSSELRMYRAVSGLSLFEHILSDLSGRHPDSIEVCELLPPVDGAPPALGRIFPQAKAACGTVSASKFERVDAPSSYLTQARQALARGDFSACSALLSPRIISVCRRYGLYGCPVAVGPGKGSSPWRYASLCGWHAGRTAPAGTFALPIKESSARLLENSTVCEDRMDPSPTAACHESVAAATSHIAILGGSFSPITSGHAAVACMVAEAAGFSPTGSTDGSGGSSIAVARSSLPRPPPVDEVWLVPCGARPDKPSLNVSAWHRYAMAVLAIEDAMPLPLPLPAAAHSTSVPQLERADSGSRFVQLRRHISGEAPLPSNEHSPLATLSTAQAFTSSCSVDTAEASVVAAAPETGPCSAAAAAAAAATDNFVPVRVMPLELLQPSAVPSYVLLNSLTRMFNSPAEYGSSGGAGGPSAVWSAAADAPVVSVPSPSGAEVEGRGRTFSSPGKTLFSLIIGADLLPTLPVWAHAQLLLRESAFLVVPRPGYPLRLRAPLRSESGASSHERIAAGFGSTLVYLPPGDPATEPFCAWLVRHPDGSSLETPEISSTAVRMTVAQARAAGPVAAAAPVLAPTDETAAAGAVASGCGGAGSHDAVAASAGDGSFPFPWSAAARMLTPSVLCYMRDNRLYV